MSGVRIASGSRPSPETPGRACCAGAGGTQWSGRPRRHGAQLDFHGLLLCRRAVGRCKPRSALLVRAREKDGEAKQRWLWARNEPTSSGFLW